MMHWKLLTKIPPTYLHLQRAPLFGLARSYLGVIVGGGGGRSPSGCKGIAG